MGIGLLVWVAIGYGVYHFFFAPKPTDVQVKETVKVTSSENKKDKTNTSTSQKAPTVTGPTYKASANEILAFKGNNGVDHYALIDSLEFASQGETTVYVKMVANGKRVDGKTYVFDVASGKCYRLNLGRGSDDLGDFTKNSFTKGLYDVIAPYTKYRKWKYVDDKSRYRKLTDNRAIVELTKPDAIEKYLITFYDSYFIVDYVTANSEAKEQALQKEVGIKQYYKDNPRTTKVKQSMGI